MAGVSYTAIGLLKKESSVRRSDTTRNKCFRYSERLLRHEGRWYFQTREGDRGPFSTREADKLELERYVDTMEYVDANTPSLPSEVDWGDVTVVDMDRPNCFSG